MKITNAIESRFVAFKMFFEGDISLMYVFEKILPSFMRRGDKSINVSLFGKPFVFPGGAVEFIGLFHEVVYSNQYHIELIKDNAVVIDAGANAGVFSIFAAVKHPNATIYAFEPTPTTFEALKENTKDYPNIKVFNHGLGDKNETASIIVAEICGGNHVGEGGIPIEIKTIDGLGIKPDFIKIDTEGYEAPVLRGAAETIKNCKPIISMSAYHNPNDKTELPAILNSITPYDCKLYRDNEEDFVCTPK